MVRSLTLQTVVIVAVLRGTLELSGQMFPMLNGIE